MSLSEMCSIANVSERTLIYAFGERYGLSPKAFIRAQRLARVRHELKRPGNFDLLVGDLAASQGFYHLGHFTEQYRRMFGETPTQTRLTSS